MSYLFRNTYKQDDSTYIEDRGYPYYVNKSDADFKTLDKEFGKILSNGQMAVKNGEDDWEVIDEFPLFLEAKKEKLKLLKKIWLLFEERGIVESKVGFIIDANSRANRDVEGLITKMESSEIDEVTFCAADNTFHTVNLEQLKAMRLEIIEYGQALYARKWELRSAIENSSTFADLEAIRITF